MKKLLLILMLFLTISFTKDIRNVSMEEKITALYVAYFQQPADYASLTYWHSQASNLKSDEKKLDILKDISEKLATQKKFLQKYSLMNNQNFVKIIYQNVLGEEDNNDDDIQYWISTLDNGLSRSDMVAIFINTTMNTIIDLETFPNLNSVDMKDKNLRENTIFNRVAVALHFTHSFKELSNIENLSSLENNPTYKASQKVLSPLYNNPLDKEVAINFINNALSKENPIAFINSNNFITISGVVTYVKPQLNNNHIGLNSNYHITSVAPKIVVKLIDDNNMVIANTTTNNQGKYQFSYIPKNTKVKVRIYSIMKNEALFGSSWNIKVIDNTNNNAVYSVEGDLISTKSSNNIRNIKIHPRLKKSAPFSILNDIYKAMKKILYITEVKFPPLTINWSVNNTSSEGLFKNGQIGTSFFDGQNSIYLLGDSYSDSDEFDTHVIIHEWSHYWERYFSRADSLGGEHKEGDRLDIRVAFSEGLGNAWSAMVTDNPIYTDTVGNRGWFMNIENGHTINAGWWAESSIQKIIYDLYDENNESHDTLSLGLKPIYDVLTTTQKETKAFTSLFSFITLLKQKVSLYALQIDKLLLDENIESIEDDIYGEEHHNLYANVGEEICTSSQYGRGNKLLNHKYLRFTIDTQKSYTIRVKQTDGKSADPDFSLYSTNPFRLKKEVSGSQKGIEISSVFLTTGDYLLDISDYRNINEVCFDISIK